MNENDRIILEYYQKHPDARQIDIEKATGIKVATIRNIRSRLERKGIAPWQNEGTKHVTVTVPAMSSARIDPERYAMAVTLPRIRFQTSPVEKVPMRLKVPVPVLTAEEELRMKRLALMKQVHRDGVRRGLFQVRSR